MGRIRELAGKGLGAYGSHGPIEAMGVERDQLPQWDSIQFLAAQLATLPQLDGVTVGADVTIGPRAKKPLELEMPLFVSDMSFGALSEEAKVALARGAEICGTGIASGEGGMLAEEQAENSRYFYELASGHFGYSIEKVKLAQAFHLQGRTGREDGHGRTPAGTQGRRQDRRGAGARARGGRDLTGALPRSAEPVRLPAGGRGGARGY